MKKHLSRIALLYAILSFVPLSISAAIKPQFNFEDIIPSFIKLDGNGKLSLSDYKFKDGKQSLCIEWEKSAKLIFDDSKLISESALVDGAGVMMWIYCPENISDTITFTFFDSKDDIVCYFNFNLGFKGWRAAWMKYEDMLTNDSYYGAETIGNRNTDISRMEMSLPAYGGRIYIDRLSFTKKKIHNQMTPDMHIPIKNRNLESPWFWTRQWEWETYQKPEIIYPDIQQVQMLRLLENRLDKWVMSSDFNIKKTFNEEFLRSRILEQMNRFKISRAEDGTMNGTQLLGKIEGDARTDMLPKNVQDICYWSSILYKKYDDPKAIDYIILTLDHAIEQGFAYGSGIGACHHYGYEIRDLYKAIWLTRAELKERGVLEKYTQLISYWSALQETRKPFEKDRYEILDTWNTLLNGRIISAMLQNTDDEKYTAMRHLSDWLSASLRYTQGTIGGLKVDGTTFHHGCHYPAYTVGALGHLGVFCMLTEGTDLILSHEARVHMKKALLTMRNYCSGVNWGFGICGRRPLSGTMKNGEIAAMGYLAVLGDLTDDGNAIDYELAGAYLDLGGKDKELLEVFGQYKIDPKSPEEGFSVYNYGCFGIHRRSDWMICLKAYNTDVWGSEIYVNANRYGRYQSYGSVQVFNNIGAKESGYVQEGWDWNRVPGTTSIYLPFDKLEAPYERLSEKNDERFPGVSSLQGKNGCLAFTYVESDHKNFCKGATATKSVFCFDNRIVFIGSGISNNSDYKTGTTLYQFHIEDTEIPIYVDGSYKSAFPYSETLDTKKTHVLSDCFKNIYIIPKGKGGKGITIERKSQTSPSNDKIKKGTANFVSAYIDHGSSPQNDSYEYLMLVEPSDKEIKLFSKNLPYVVYQADTNAHVVKDKITEITGYVCYKEYTSDKGLIERIPAETIVMEQPMKDNESIAMSICTPDLGLENKGYFCFDHSKPIAKEVVLNGKYALLKDYEGVSIITENGKSYVTALCVHGQPADFILKAL